MLPVYVSVEILKNLIKLKLRCRISKPCRCCVDRTYLIWILRNDIVGSNSAFFDRSWSQFTREFGSPTSQYWIGLDRLHDLTSQNCQIRFDIQDIYSTCYFAQYSSFQVGDSSSNYLLTIGGYSGDAGDAMVVHSGQQFSTYDADNDAWEDNCASYYGGGFWYASCYVAGLTTSPASSHFYWNNRVSVYYLNIIEVRLLC